MNSNNVLQRYDEYPLPSIKYVSKINKNRSLQHFYMQ